MMFSAHFCDSHRPAAGAGKNKRNGAGFESFSLPHKGHVCYIRRSSQSTLRQYHLTAKIIVLSNLVETASKNYPQLTVMKNAMPSVKNGSKVVRQQKKVIILIGALQAVARPTQAHGFPA